MKAVKNRKPKKKEEKTLEIRETKKKNERKKAPDFHEKLNLEKKTTKLEKEK